MADNSSAPASPPVSSPVPAPAVEVIHDQATSPVVSSSPAAPSTTHEPTPTANGSVTATLQSAKETVVSSQYSCDDKLAKRNAMLTRVSRPIRHFISAEQPDHSGTRQCLRINRMVSSINTFSGPVAQNVKDEAAKTSSEFQSIASARTVPEQPAATGQALTQYHSMFYRLLSWEKPRATAITFGGTIVLIFAARYFNILKWAFKLTYYILGVTATIEIAGKLLLDNGLATKMRPKKYWTIPRESLERSLEDVEQLLNFFVIECQRIVWAENVYATVAVFSAALVSYWLIKLLPFWGLSLIGTCVLYLTPLVYMKNRETIDSGFEQVTTVIGSQASQLKHITAEQTGKATESLKAYTSEYTHKAQEYMGSRKSSGPTAVKPSVTSNDFPAAPKEEPVVTTSHSVPNPADTDPFLAH